MPELMAEHDGQQREREGKAVAKVGQVMDHPWEGKNVRLGGDRRPAEGEVVGIAHPHHRRGQEGKNQ